MSQPQYVMKTPHYSPNQLEVIHAPESIYQQIESYTRQIMKTKYEINLTEELTKDIESDIKQEKQKLSLEQTSWQILNQVELLKLSIGSKLESSDRKQKFLKDMKNHCKCNFQQQERKKLQEKKEEIRSLLFELQAREAASESRIDQFNQIVDEYNQQIRNLEVEEETLKRANMDQNEFARNNRSNFQVDLSEPKRQLGILKDRYNTCLENIEKTKQKKELQKQLERLQQQQKSRQQQQRPKTAKEASQGRQFIHSAQKKQDPFYSNLQNPQMRSAKMNNYAHLASPMQNPQQSKWRQGMQTARINYRPQPSFGKPEQLPTPQQLQAQKAMKNNCVFHSQEITQKTKNTNFNTSFKNKAQRDPLELPPADRPTNNQKCHIASIQEIPTPNQAQHSVPQQRYSDQNSISTKKKGKKEDPTNLQREQPQKGCPKSDPIEPREPAPLVNNPVNPSENQSSESPLKIEETARNTPETQVQGKEKTNVEVKNVQREQNPSQQDIVPEDDIMEQFAIRETGIEEKYTMIESKIEPELIFKPNDTKAPQTVQKLVEQPKKKENKTQSFEKNIQQKTESHQEAPEEYELDFSQVQENPSEDDKLVTEQTQQKVHQETDSQKKKKKGKKTEQKEEAQYVEDFEIEQEQPILNRMASSNSIDSFIKEDRDGESDP